MSLPRLVSPLLALLAVCAVPAGAQVAGDTGRAPTNAAECQAFLKSVDRDLKWENDRWAKLSGSKLDRRAATTKRIRTLKAANAEMRVKMDALQVALDAGRQADPPMAENEALDLENQILSLDQDSVENTQRIDGLRYQITDIDAELKRLRKLHVSNVRNTVEYRKQVADYCKRF